MRELWLVHHGIKGQKWGVRNGPPYPLKPSVKSTIRKKKHLGYQVSGFANLSASEDERSYRVMEKMSKLTSDFQKTPEGNALLAKQREHVENMEKNSPQRFGEIYRTAVKYGGSLNREPISDNPRVIGTLSEALSNTNKYFNTAEGNVNCASCAIAGVLRRKGINAYAKPAGNYIPVMNVMVEDAFKNCDIKLGPSTMFTSSQDYAASMLRSMYGDNAIGTVGVIFRGGGGHAFSWEIKDGKVRFLDFQQKEYGNNLNVYWRGIDPTGPVTLCNLTNAEIDYTKLSKYVDIKQ